MNVRLHAIILTLLLAGCASQQTPDGPRSSGPDQIASEEEVRMDAPETLGIMATQHLVDAAVNGKAGVVSLFEANLPTSLYSERVVHLWDSVSGPRLTWYGMAIEPSGQATFMQGYLPEGESRMILIVSGPVANSARVVLFSTGGEFMTNLQGEKKPLPAKTREMYAFGSTMMPMSTGAAKVFLASLETDFVAYERRGVHTLYPKDLGEETIAAAMSTNPQYTALGRIEARGGIAITPDLAGTALATGLGAAFAAADFSPMKLILTGDGSSSRFYESER